MSMKRRGTFLSIAVYCLVCMFLFMSPPARAGSVEADWVAATNNADTSYFLGNVGVGTSTPSNDLHVAGGLTVDGAMTIPRQGDVGMGSYTNGVSAGGGSLALLPGGQQGNLLYHDGTEWVVLTNVFFNEADGKLYFNSTSSGTCVDTTTGIFDLGGNSITNADVSGDLSVDGTTLHVDSANNRLGVGTDNPTMEMELYRNGQDVELRIHEDAGTHVPGIALRQGTKDAKLSINTTGHLVLESKDNAMDLILEAKQFTNAVHVDVLNARVGIGIGAPSHRLHVNGDAKLEGGLNMGTNGITQLSNPTNDQDAATKGYVDSRLAYVSRDPEPAAADFTEATLTLNTTTDLDLSSIVPSTAEAVNVRLQVKDGSTGKELWIRCNGDTNWVNGIVARTQLSNQRNDSAGIVACDGDQVIEYWISSGTDEAVITVLGWFE